MEKIPVKNDAKKLSPQRSHWGEEGIKKVILPAGTLLVHVSVQGKIRAFAPVLTCFNRAEVGPGLPGHIYLLRTLATVQAEQVDEAEIRIDLAENGRKVEIYYIGYTRPNRRLAVRDRFGRVVYTPWQFCITAAAKNSPGVATLVEGWRRREREKMAWFRKRYS